MMRLFRSLGTRRDPGRPAALRHASAEFRRFRPSFDALEDRVVMSAAVAAPPLAPALVSAAAPALQQASSILPIVINSVVAEAGQLLANASLGSHNFQIPLTLGTPSGQSPTSSTPILNLHLGPIDLNLLGLEVKTSEICLNITAQSGPGNLLGNLLADVAHLLDQGIPLSQVLGNLTADNLSALTTGLTGLLNGAFGQLTSVTTLTSPGNRPSVSSSGDTTILHLSVGPLHLNLLGLQVDLDNCHNGPITVDIIAHTGPGNLLGNLLSGLAHLLDSNANTHALVNKLEKIAGEIAALL